MKIGIDARIFSDQFTGIGRYNFELTRFFFSAPEYKNVQWVIFMNQPEFDIYNFPKNVKKVCVNAKHYTLAEQIKFCYRLYREGCDLVHFTHFNVPFLYWKPFVVTIHDTIISFFPGKKMNTWWRKFAYKMVFRHAIKNSKRLIAVSNNTKKDILKFFPQVDKKTLVVWNGIGEEFRKIPKESTDQILKKYKITDPYLLYTGVWREHKNLLGLIKVFGKIRKKSPQLKLVITGKEDPFYPEVKDTIKNLGLQSHVYLVGLVNFSDLLGLYNGARVFVFPSFYEGFGFPPLEAMKVGTPVCASEVSSIPEICGEGALYFDPYVLEDMEAKIERIFREKELSQKLIQKGFLRAKKFDWKVCAQSTFKVYESAL